MRWEQLEARLSGGADPSGGDGGPGDGTELLCPRRGGRVVTDSNQQQQRKQRNFQLRLGGKDPWRPLPLPSSRCWWLQQPRQSPAAAPSQGRANNMNMLLPWGGIPSWGLGLVKTHGG